LKQSPLDVDPRGIDPHFGTGLDAAEIGFDPNAAAHEALDQVIRRARRVPSNPATSGRGAPSTCGSAKRTSPPAFQVTLGPKTSMASPTLVSTTVAT
jgi:hypothetical protein